MGDAEEKDAPVSRDGDASPEREPEGAFHEQGYAIKAL
jgi:hypothetical protein